MTGTAQRLRPDDLQKLQQFRQKRLRALVRDAFFLTVCLGIVLLGRAGITFFNRDAPRTGWFNLSFACVIVGFVGLYLALAPLCSLFIRLFHVHALPRVLQWQNILFLNLYLLISLPLVLLMTTIWKPFRFLHAGFFNDVTSRCFFVVIITSVLLFLTRRVFPFPRFNQIIRQITIGMALAFLLALALGFLLPLAGLSLHFDKTRIVQGSILFLMLWLIFLLHEGVVHSWREKGTPSAFLFSFSVRVCLWVVVYVFSVLSPEKRVLESIWLPLVVVFLFLQRCCSLLYRKGRAAIAGVTLSACILAWIMTSI